MIVSYTTGVDILRNHLDQIDKGQFRVLLLFLGTAYDEAFLDSVKLLAKDLDVLTGPHCLAVAFMPPPQENPFTLYGDIGTFQGGGKDRNIAEWDSFVSEMTKNTYELARFLNIPEHHLPCLVFIDTDNTEFALLRLRDKTLRDIYPKLRRIFSDWYSENREAFDQYDLVVSDRGYIGQSSHIKRIKEDKLRQEIIPHIERAFLAAVTTNNNTLDISKVKRHLNRLRKQPTNTKPLIDVLRLNNLTIELEGSQVSWKDFDLAYRSLYRRKIQPEDNWFSTRPTLTSSITKFPMDKVEQLNDSVELKKVGADISNWVAGKKPMFDIVISILKLFGFAA